MLTNREFKDLQEFEQAFYRNLVKDIVRSTSRLSFKANGQIDSYMPSAKDEEFVQRQAESLYDKLQSGISIHHYLMDFNEFLKAFNHGSSNK